MWVCLCASEEKEDEEFIEFIAHGEEREKKRRTKINKIINTHATVTVHICTIMHKLVWAFFCSNCLKLATFSILHNYV